MADPFRASRQLERAMMQAKTSRKLPPGTIILASPGTLLKALNAYDGEVDDVPVWKRPNPLGSRVDQTPSPTPVCAKCGTSVRVEGTLCEVCSGEILEMSRARAMSENDMIVWGRAVNIPAKPPLQPARKPSPAPPAKPGKRKYDFGE